MTEQEKAWIDEANYEQLLQRWRFAPAGGDPIFQGDTGDYYSKVMQEKRTQTSDNGVGASKSIGWDK